MSDPYVGEIRMFAGNFAPRNWAFCDGQLLTVSQNDALFSLFGTIYGGDGRTTFGLPDLRGRVPIHAGSGPGLTSRIIGARAGAETHRLTENELAAHSHGFLASEAAAEDSNPAGNVLATPTSPNIYGSGAAIPMSPEGTTPTGGNATHPNMMPSTVISFIVALYGIYPSRA